VTNPHLPKNQIYAKISQVSIDTQINKSLTLEIENQFYLMKLSKFQLKNIKKLELPHLREQF